MSTRISKGKESQPGGDAAPASSSAPTDRQLQLCHGLSVRVETLDPRVGRALLNNDPRFRGDTLFTEAPLGSLVTFSYDRIATEHDPDRHALHAAHLYPGGPRGSLESHEPSSSSSSSSSANEDRHLAEMVAHAHVGEKAQEPDGGGSGSGGGRARARHSVDDAHVPLPPPGAAGEAAGDDGLGVYAEMVNRRSIGARSLACDACMRARYAAPGAMRTSLADALDGTGADTDLDEWSPCPRGCGAYFCGGSGCSLEQRRVHDCLCEGRTATAGHAPYELKMHCEEVNPAFALAARLLCGCALRVIDALAAEGLGEPLALHGGERGSASLLTGRGGASAEVLSPAEHRDAVLRDSALPHLGGASAAGGGEAHEALGDAASRRDRRVEELLAADRIVTGFRRVPWWEAAPFAPDSEDPMSPEEHVASMRETSRDSARLLRATLVAAGLDADVVEAVCSDGNHALTMGLLERNMIEVDVPHPLVAVCENIDALPRSADRDAAVRATVAEIVRIVGPAADDAAEDILAALDDVAGGEDAKDDARDSGGDHNETDSNEDGNGNGGDSGSESDDVMELVEAFGDLLPSIEGIAIFELANGCLNHSCDPNARIYFDEGSHRACVLAIRDIEPDEEVFISYIDEDAPFEEREADLNVYGFACQCPRCSADRSEEGAV